MSWIDRFFPRGSAPAPQASYQEAGGGINITTPEELDAALRDGSLSEYGPAVTPSTAMRVAAVYGSVRLISGAVATLPIHIKRRVDDRTRVDASEVALWQVIRRRPNGWQKPAQFKRQLQAHVLLRGNAYAMKVWSRGEVRSLIPLHPDRVEVKQRPDFTLAYEWMRPDGRIVTFEQSDILHLFGLTLDGFRGVTPITFARETIGAALAMEKQGAALFKNGAQTPGALRTDQKLNKDQVADFRTQLDEYRAGGEQAGKVMVLHSGLDFKSIAMTQADAQWIEARKFSRSDIAMFFGVPPHMLGDTEKSTSWGTGIEQQSQGFVTYTLEDHLTMWEETLTTDCLGSDQADLYARFNRAALVRGDLKTRWEAHVKSLQWGVRSPNEIRALEDENPRDGGDIYYPPPNTAGGIDPVEDNVGAPKPKEEADQ